MLSVSLLLMKSLNKTETNTFYLYCVLFFFFLDNLLCFYRKTFQIKCFFKLQVLIFFFFLPENICCGTYKKCLIEAILKSTQNICFCGEVIEILFGYPSYLEL